MEEPKLSDSELYSIFEKCGWYKGRKEDIIEDLPLGYKELPIGVYSFLEEFFGLDLQYEFEFEHEEDGEIERIRVDTMVSIFPDMGYDGKLDDSGLRYYSKIIGKELYPIGMKGHSYVALDVDLNMYILELGSGCMLLSNNPIDGLRKMLMNELYKDTYDLVELKDNEWEWVER